MLRFSAFVPDLWTGPERTDTILEKANLFSIADSFQRVSGMYLRMTTVGEGGKYAEDRGEIVEAFSFPSHCGFRRIATFLYDRNLVCQ